MVARIHSPVMLTEIGSFLWETESLINEPNIMRTQKQTLK